MKSLQDFILENVEVIESKSESKTITFNFDGLENAEDTLKSFEGKEGCSIEENKLTVTITPDNFNKLDTVQDILQQYYETERSSQKHSSSEQYANLIKKFGEQLDSFNTAIDDFENPEEE